MSDRRPEFSAPEPSSSTYQPVPGPQPQAPAYAPTGELVLNLRKPFGAMGMITPVVNIDGYPVNVAWGRNLIPAPAGAHQVNVASSYLWNYGKAVLPVSVEPGRTTEVFYAGPWMTFMRGAMGFTEQKRPGTTALIVMFAVVGLLVLLSIVGIVLSASS